MTSLDFLFIILSGAAGGLLSAIFLNEGNLVPPGKISMEGRKSALHLGFLGDIILGAGAGLIATLPMDLEYPKYIYVSMLAGFGGGNFIAKQAKGIAEEKLNRSSGLPDLPSQPISNQPGGMVELEIDEPEEGGKK